MDSYLFWKVLVEHSFLTVARFQQLQGWGFPRQGTWLRDNSNLAGSWKPFCFVAWNCSLLIPICLTIFLCSVILLGSLATVLRRLALYCKLFSFQAYSYCYWWWDIKPKKNVYSTTHIIPCWCLFLFFNW